MTDPIHADLLRELVTIQRARSLNWREPSGPLDATLEQSHADRLAAIKSQISAHATREAPGTSEAPPATVTIRGGCTEAAGNIFSRIIRRILPPKH